MMKTMNTLNIFLFVLAAIGIVSDATKRKSRGTYRFRESGWWKNGYQNQSNHSFTVLVIVLITKKSLVD